MKTVLTIYLSTFVDSINVFDCRLSSVISVLGTLEYIREPDERLYIAALHIGLGKQIF